MASNNFGEYSPKQPLWLEAVEFKANTSGSYDCVYPHRLNSQQHSSAESHGETPSSPGSYHNVVTVTSDPPNGIVFPVDVTPKVLTQKFLLPQSFPPTEGPSTLETSSTSSEVSSVIQKRQPPTSPTITSSKKVSNSSNSDLPEIDRFDTNLVKNVIQALIAGRIRQINYESHLCKRLAQTLTADIMERLKTLRFPSYKYVVMCSLGNVLHHKGLQFGSRCLWSKDSDHFVDIRYNNGSIYAVALIYAVTS